MLPTVTNCFYFISLRTAGLILGVISICIEIFYVAFGVNLIIMLLFMATSFAWIYGILTNKPMLMVPNLVIHLVPVAVPICTYVLMAVFGDPQRDYETFLWLIISALLLHFWIVQYSLYKSMVKLQSSEGNNEVNRMEVTMFPL